MAATETLRSTLTETRGTWARVVQMPLSESDLTRVNVVFSKEIARGERRLAKMLAKAQAQAQAQAESEDGEATEVERGRADTEAERGAEPVGSGDQDNGARGDSSDTAASAENDPKEEPRRGHGRNGAGAYVNAEHRLHELLGVIGMLCEACGLGVMSRYREKLTVVIKGRSLFGAEIHHFEQARCRLCNAIIRADGAGAVSSGLGGGYITYDWSACAMLLVMHYFAGMPFKRLELLQAGWGIPMPDANQWRLAEECADLLLPLYRALERYGVRNAYALRIDDTGSMVIAVRREIRAELDVLKALGESTKDVRTGINATGVYLETEQGTVLLFYTGRHHAGEIVDSLLRHRRGAQSGHASGDKLVKVSDGASKNFSHVHQDQLEETVCNAHAYLKFRDVKKLHPEEYAVAGEVYKKVFDNDDAAKAAGMSPEKRMLYHREHSLPEMRRLHKMCQDKLKSRLAEPNAPLWEPVNFIINQWERLTKFCRVPGIPLDTNVVEQMLIIPVRYLAGSFNYKTVDGADVGDRHMSLIATANANGVEPVAYLTACLQNHEDVARRPEHYLPWVYRERVEALSKAGPSRPEPDVSEGPPARTSVQHPLRPGTCRGPVGEVASQQSVPACP